MNGRRLYDEAALERIAAAVLERPAHDEAEPARE
jgi:hypothetical protein